MADMDDVCAYMPLCARWGDALAKVRQGPYRAILALACMPGSRDGYEVCVVQPAVRVQAGGMFRMEQVLHHVGSNCYETA
eukprot:1139079-Pelagomonas_calceolata.AAC.4